MKRLIAPLIVAACLAACLVAVSPAPARSAAACRITNGHVDAANQFSNVGAIVLVGHPTLSVPRITCTGTLIAPRVFLTAGHCTDLFQSWIDAGIVTLADFRISFGVDALDPGTWLEIDGLITHPDFAHTGFQGWAARPIADIGAVVLTDPVAGVPMVPLAPLGLLDQLLAAGALTAGPHGTRLAVSGYGVTNEWPPIANMGQWIVAPGLIPPDGLRRFADTLFQALVPGWLVLSHNNAAFGIGGVGFGDSGGPAFWTAPGGASIQVALVSTGDPVLVSHGFYYRLDTPEAIGFIEAVLASVDL